MGSFIVRKAWAVTADTAEEAVAKVEGEPDFVRVSAGLPEERHGFERHYSQSIEVLDAAWDLFHERDQARRMGDAPPDAAPTPGFVEMSLNGVSLPEISLLFDLAITGYRERYEPDGRRTS